MKINVNYIDDDNEQSKQSGKPIHEMSTQEIMATGCGIFR